LERGELKRKILGKEIGLEPRMEHNGIKILKLKFSRS